uniref:Helicase ATP-binding domain-containing protein n=1 Tax=Coturnix japonica TaxID=93934 RepID=A0A8C2Y915_COTJA
MFSSADEVFSLENLFYERPDPKKRDLENKSDIWWIAPAPAIDEIPPAEELQRELETSTASSCMLGGIKHQKFIQQRKNITEEVNDKSPAPTHFGKASEKEMLRLCVGERTNKHESLQMTSMFLSPDQAKYKIGTKIFQQPDADFSQTKILTNFPENGDDESVHSAFRRSLFKMPDCTYKNTEFKDSSMHMKAVDTHFNTSENMTEAKKEIWRENRHPPVTADSGFTLHRSLSSASKILEMTGTAGRNLEMLRAVTEIPTQFRCIFKEFPYFNYAQSKALDDLLYTDRNFVICAPTGSGKTVMFELAITRLLMEVPMPWLNIKVVYMAPIKALCSQRFDDWKEKFGPIGLSCKELTGDTVVDDLFEIHHAHIIITTPEKWDSMTRRWKDNSIVQLVRLFLIDEARKLMTLYACFLLEDERKTLRKYSI